MASANNVLARNSKTTPCEVAYRKNGRRQIGRNRHAHSRWLVPVDTQTMERSMHIPQERPWPTIDLAELRFGIAFGSSVEELADFLERDVEDVRQKWAAEVQRSAM